MPNKGCGFCFETNNTVSNFLLQRFKRNGVSLPVTKSLPVIEQLPGGFWGNDYF
jgi:hypothetical protein